MDENKELSLLPSDSPILSLNKANIQILVSKVCENLTDGMEDPIKALVIGKKLDELSKIYNASVRPLLAGKIKLQKGETYRAFDVEIKEEESGVRYDYSACNDIEWNSLTWQIEPLLAERKLREDFLKTLRQEYVDEETGEVIQPPLRTGSLVYKLSLKK